MGMSRDGNLFVYYANFHTFLKIGMITQKNRENGARAEQSVSRSAPSSPLFKNEGQKKAEVVICFNFLLSFKHFLIKSAFFLRGLGLDKESALCKKTKKQKRNNKTRQLFFCEAK